MARWGKQQNFKYRVFGGVGDHAEYGTMRSVDVVVLHKIAPWLAAILTPVWCDECKAYHVSDAGTGELEGSDAVTVDTRTVKVQSRQGGVHPK